MQPFQLFSYSLMPSCPQAVVQFQFKLHLLMDIYIEKTATVKYDQGEICDMHFQRVSSHTLSRSDVYSSYIEIDQTTSMMIGKEVWDLDLTSFAITTLQPLAVPRNGQYL